MGTQAVKPRGEHGHDSDQISNQFFFWGERFAIDYGDLGPMSLTELLKPIIAKANEPILTPDDHPRDFTQFDLFNDLIKASPLVIERGADVFHLLVDLDSMLLTVRAKRFFLHGEILFLARGRHTSIRNHQPLCR